VAPRVCIPVTLDLQCWDERSLRCTTRACWRYILNCCCGTAPDTFHLTQPFAILVPGPRDTPTTFPHTAPAPVTTHLRAPLCAPLPACRARPLYARTFHVGKIAVPAAAHAVANARTRTVLVATFWFLPRWFAQLHTHAVRVTADTPRHARVLTAAVGTFLRFGATSDERVTDATHPPV